MDWDSVAVPEHGENALLVIRQDLRSKFLGLLEEVETEAQSLKVDSQASASEATAIVGRTKRLASDLEKERKRLIEDAQAFVKGVNDTVRPFTDVCKRIKDTLTQQLNEYTAFQKMEQMKAEALGRKAIEDAQKRLNRDAKKLGVEAPVIQAPTTGIKAEVIRTETGTSYGRAVWDFRLIDIRDVPSQFLILDEKLIRAAIRAGARTIPGIEIYEKTQVNIRM